MNRAKSGFVGFSILFVCACGGEPSRAPSRTAHARKAPAPAATAPAEEVDGLSQEQIIPIVEARYPAVRGCHTMQFAGTGSAVAGVMTVDLQIAASGKVTSASIADSTFESDQLAECVLDVTRSLQFPKAEGSTEFSWRFKFRAPG